ncbi:hypothetical protein FQN54_004771 [Arachnomyces sp. PD_36]|nr:hypothetical protein FQN54_004771 [Arachnomyces sp. PD_36]
MSSNPVTLQFGIEMEFLLKPKPIMSQTLRDYGFKNEIPTRSQDTEDTKDQNNNRTAIRASLVKLLRAAEIPATLNPGDYQQWTPVDERSLDERPGFWRCEIVSRILDTGTNWQDEIDQVFDTLTENCEILLTPGCSMHVHVTPNTGKFNIDQIKRILKGVIYYDTPMTRIMPADRKKNIWAQSNVEVCRPWRDACLQVSQKKWAPLFDDIEKHKMMQHIVHATLDRHVAWNFQNLTGACGTIEFRRPPGVKSSADVKHWAAVALGFVTNAMVIQDWNTVRSTGTYPSSNDLRSAITGGAQRLGPSLQGALGSMADVNDPPTVLSSQELARIERKKKDKSKKKSIFAEKVSNSRPNTPVGA